MLQGMPAKLLLLLWSFATLGFCAEPVRLFPRVPPPGLPIPTDIQQELEKGLADLGNTIQQLQSELKSKPGLLELLPDVQIYHKAVCFALEDKIFYRTNDFAAARRLLTEGTERAQSLQKGESPWATATGLIVRGYRSRLDGSIQPYGLVVPPSFTMGAAQRHRLDFWFHGRNANLSELSFITERENNRGEFTPENAFVLHPYGRYCNANKFAGEVDTFEALDHVRRHYPIDENRICVRGFSMGGAATWHLAAHHAGLWAAAAPGAGFVDTAVFQKVAQWTNQPPWYVQQLWHLYDATDYAANLFNCPVVAYSGEIDAQKQAADLMTKAMAAEGLELVHIIGPNTAHKFEPKAKEEVARRIDALAEKGRNPVPKKVRFTTWTLRYNRNHWVTVDALEHHWTRARVEAEIVGSDRINLSTTNVSALTLSMPLGLCPLETSHRANILIDDQELTAPAVAQDRSWTAHLQKHGSRWRIAKADSDNTLRKRHGLQGPIDDAFMDSFIMVRPTGKPFNDAVGAFTDRAMGHALQEWRLQFRGQPRVAEDRNITDADIASHNLVLWGDPQSNRLLGRIAKKLPIRWDSAGIRMLGQTYPSSSHVPVLIYPNPLNPHRYVVVNSGFTFSDAGPTSNALQIPELPDYAVLEMATQRVTTAGFFDEFWGLSPKSPESASIK
jgi:pimeloyl-ACP methyl ester carboxylesterase